MSGEAKTATTKEAAASRKKRASNPNRGAKPGERRGGRQKGTPNKLTTEVKEMILQALNEAGGVSYLVRQADNNPGPFMTLVGKVLPLQVSGSGTEGEHVYKIVLEGVMPK